MKFFWILCWLCSEPKEIKQDFLDNDEALGCSVYTSSTTVMNKYDEIKSDKRCMFMLFPSTEGYKLRTLVETKFIPIEVK